MANLACIGQPVSWLRLEMFALDGADVGVREHVATCEACRHCLDEIQRDVVALPPVHVPAKRRWWTFAMPAVAAVAAVAVILFLLTSRSRFFVIVSIPRSRNLCSTSTSVTSYPLFANT